MKSFNSFLNEKLIINKDIKINSNKEATTYDIIIAAYLSIKRNKCWEEGSTFKRVVKYIKYDDILDILNTYFNYNIDNDSIKRNGDIFKTVKEYKVTLNNLVNLYSATTLINNERIVINPKDIDNKYENILKEKK